MLLPRTGVKVNPNSSPASRCRKQGAVQPAKVQEAGGGARGKLCKVGAPHSLQRCSKQGAVHGLRVPTDSGSF